MNGWKFLTLLLVGIAAFGCRAVWPDSPEIAWAAGVAWGAAMLELVIGSRRKDRTA